MKKQEIIKGLKSLVDDRDSFITSDKEDSAIFIHDKNVLLAAIDYIEHSEEKEELIATKYYAFGKLSEVEKRVILSEQLGFLKARNRYLEEKGDKNAI